MDTKAWTVHPNRSVAGPNEPGRNGNFRPTPGLLSAIGTIDGYAEGCRR